VIVDDITYHRGDMASRAALGTATVETAQSFTTGLSETMIGRAVSNLGRPPPARLPGNEPAAFHNR
jgi:hypothetical protein